MGNIVAGERKDVFIEEPEVIDGPDPDGHASPGKLSVYESTCACCAKG